MNTFRVIPLLLIFFIPISGSSNDDKSAVFQTQKYSDSGQPTNVVIEYFASNADIEASRHWHPYSKNLPAPLAKVIETAYVSLKVPDGKLVYAKPTVYSKKPKNRDPFSSAPDLRGMDLRRLTENLWCWEVYFGLSLDRSIESQVSVRGGDLLLSAKVLPNGGSITIKERKMNRKERILYGLESDPNAKDPFAP